MCIATVTIDYDNIRSSIYTDYDNLTLSNCTNNEKSINIRIPTILLTIPCSLSISCLMGLMVYTLVKPLFNNE